MKYRLYPLILSLALLSAALLVLVDPALAQGRDEIVRGAYLVKAMGCADCHAPLKMGPNGPAPDLSRGLSGHPQDMVLPPAPPAQGPWLWGGAGSNTAFWGPWGVSYAANLTPDRDTGLGAWRTEDFIGAMRTGRHLGVERPILPPMPWEPLGHLSDSDLKAMLAYLQSRPAVPNRVPAPTPPAAAPVASPVSTPVATPLTLSAKPQEPKP